MEASSPLILLLDNYCILPESFPEDQIAKINASLSKVKLTETFVKPRSLESDGPRFESLGFNLTWSPSSLQWAIEDTSNKAVPSLCMNRQPRDLEGVKLDQ